MKMARNWPQCPWTYPIYCWRFNPVEHDSEHRFSMRVWLHLLLLFNLYPVLPSKGACAASIQMIKQLKYLQAIWDADLECLLSILHFKMESVEKGSVGCLGFCLLVLTCNWAFDVPWASTSVIAFDFFCNGLLDLHLYSAEFSLHKREGRKVIFTDIFPPVWLQHSVPPTDLPGRTGGPSKAAQWQGAISKNHLPSIHPAGSVCWILVPSVNRRLSSIPLS